MVTGMRAKRFIGLGLLGVALAGGGFARAQPDDGPGRSIQEQLLRFQQLIPGQEGPVDFGAGEELTPETHGIGVAVAGVDETMRVQLDLPEKQGVVVTEVAPESAAAAAGLKEHDVLLKLGDDPVRGPEDLDARFRDRGEEPVAIHLRRGGKETTVRVAPRAPAGRRAYFIGVSAAPLPDALRSQLGLPEDQGVVAGDVLPESPAAKAGIQPHDILLTVDEKPVRDVEGLVARIQEIEDKTVAVKLLRGGKPKTVEVTPEKRPDSLPGRAPERLRVPRDLPPFGSGIIIGPDGMVRPARPGQLPLPRGLPGALGAPSRQLQRRVDELTSQLKELRKQVEELRKSATKE
ncbi:MAG TPA: PDZ domain-containing protein [Isosphaeraceae bacterium]|jgi:serine protease Do